MLARVETALRPYDLSFSRFELLRLLAFSRSGALPITTASDRLQVHVTSVTHAIRRLEANGLVQRVPHPTDGRTTLVQITDLGRSTVEDATVTLNEQLARTTDVELRKVMYNLIENQTKTLMLANGRTEYAFEVVDAAIPPELKNRPHRTLMVLVGLAVGLTLGVAAAVIRDRFERSRQRGLLAP